MADSETVKPSAAETVYKPPLVLHAQPRGGYTVTCPILPELITEGDSIRQALDNVADALAALLEAYETLGRTIPDVLKHASPDQPLWLETAVVLP